MRELQEALASVGLSWRDVWVLTVDRRAGTLVVVAADGRKFRVRLGRAAVGRPMEE
jgi:hypothetical protein